MIKSVLHQTKKALLFIVVLLGLLVNYSFTPSVDEQELLTWSNKCLAQAYDPSNEPKLKKWDLQLNDEGFIRLRKTYQNNKQEYFSLHLDKLREVGYTGDANAGVLQLMANADDIIVQTYDDPKGNVDSMTTSLDIPVRNMPTQRVDSLRSALNYFKSKAL